MSTPAIEKKENNHSNEHVILTYVKFKHIHIMFILFFFFFEENDRSKLHVRLGHNEILVMHA